MTFSDFRTKLSVPLEWIARQIAARPKGFLVLWGISLIVTGWIV